MLATRMKQAAAGVVTNPYLAVVNSLSATVIAYWPLDESSGSTVNDRSGNGRGGTITGNVTPGAAGLLGTAFSFAGAVTDYIYAGAALRAAIDPTEYSCSFFAKVTSTPANQARLHALNLDSGEYVAVAEVRSGLRLDQYQSEQAQAQSYQASWLPDATWLHIVVYNSESTGQFGFYVNRVFLPAGRSTPGAIQAIATENPFFGKLFVGSIQHIVWMDTGLPSQADVNLLYNGGGFPEVTGAVLSDTFDGSESAPIASPRASGLVVTDTGSLMSLSSGALIWTGKTSDVAVPRILTPTTQALKWGRAVVAVVNTGSVATGWRTTNTGSPNTEAFLMQSGTLFSYATGELLSWGAIAGGEYKVAFVRSEKYTLHLIKGGVYTEWTIVNISRTPIEAAAPVALYGGFGVGSTSASNSVNAVKVYDLPAPFNLPYTEVTSRLPATVSAGATFTHEGNAFVSFIVGALPSADYIDFRFRVQDASNYWSLRIATTGALTLWETVAGTPTDRSPSAETAAGNYVYTLQLIGSTIRLIRYVPSGDVSSIRWTYSSASNFATETDGELTSLGTGGRVTEIIAWPRTLGASAAAVLDAAVA